MPLESPLIRGQGRDASTPPERRPESGALDESLRRVKLFLCDVDGILTDASIYIGGPEEIKRFNIQDGLGLRLLQREGVKVGWISNRASTATLLRAQELKIDFLNQDSTPKVAAAEQILAQAGLTWSDIAYMGDDIVDLGLLKRAGLAITVPNAIEEVKQVSHYVTRAWGGHGAVREVVEMILKAQDKWDRLVEHFAQ